MNFDPESETEYLARRIDGKCERLETSITKQLEQLEKRIESLEKQIYKTID